MEVSPSILERIFAAADTLYISTGEAAYPTVDAVRKQAKVNMNDASSGMKEWRRLRHTQSNRHVADLPPALVKAATLSLQALWDQATSSANEALNAAQSAWQMEQKEQETLSEQMAAAYDKLADEVEGARAKILLLETQLVSLNTALDTAHNQTDQLERENVLVTAAADQACAIKLQVELRAAELRRELDQVYAALARSNNEAAEARRLAAQELSTSRHELEQLRQQTADQAAAFQAQLSAAREEVAEIRGALDATKTGQIRNVGSTKNEMANSRASTSSKHNVPPKVCGSA